MSLDALFIRPGPRTTAPPWWQPGHDLVEVVTIDGTTTRRLWCALTFRARILLARARLAYRGASEIRAFAAAPSLDVPTFLYELGTPAAVYASVNLRLGTTGRFEWVRRALAVVMGCDSATGAVVLIGRRS